MYSVKLEAGKQRFMTRHDYDFERWRGRLEGVAFLAVTTNSWPAGLVPVFLVEKTNRFELRRHAPRGLENSTEPLFFALPLEDEPEASRIAGRWECHATRGDGSEVRLGWELAADAGKVSGRFDQNTDYRFAFVTGGSFRSNRLELHVEHGMDAYLLAGQWRDGRLEGQWRRADDAEQGNWEALRSETRPLPDGEIVALYEWRRASDGALRYGVEKDPVGTDWERMARPLCRVWKAASKGGK